jgi:hypothetical protein
MPIDPRISLGVQPLQVPDQLAKYGQVQNILASQAQQQAAGTQQRMSEMQLKSLQRNSDYVDTMQRTIQEKGGPLDVSEAAKIMAMHPDPNVAQHGYTLMQAIQDKQMFEDYVKGQTPDATPAPAAAPSMMRQQPAPVNKLGSGVYGIDTSATNQLAPAPAFVPAAAPAAVSSPVVLNASPVGAPISADAQVAQLKKEILQLSLLRDPRAKSLLTLKEAELKNLQAFHSVPNVGLVNAAGTVAVKAEATPTELSRLMAERDALPPGDSRRETYLNKIAKETEAAPSQIAQMIKERDALPPGDPNRAAYTAKIEDTRNQARIAQERLDVAKKAQALAERRFKEDMAVGKLEPATIDLLAQTYLQTGVIPSMGMGQKGAEARTKILNRAQQISMGTGGATAAEAATNIVKGKQDVAAQAATVKDFSSGLSARRVTANNTALNHLETMDKLAGDLANTDVRIANAAGNAFARATGSAAPPNFDAAKQLVAAEVIKAVVQNGGGVTERQEAAENIKSANSPEQLRGVIETYRELLGGQLTSLAQQYETGSGRKDFDKKLSPATRALLKKSTPAAAPANANATVSNW